MNVNQTTCAAADHDFAWKSIDWKKCEVQVKKLQERIVKASIIKFNQTYVFHCGIIDSEEEVVLCQIQ